MSEITIFLNNVHNSAENNPPGFSQWVGGNSHGDPAGIKVTKEDTKLAYKIPQSINYLQTWYYDYGWCSGGNLDGPFTNGQIIELPPVSGSVLNDCCFFLPKYSKSKYSEITQK
jgi:hypothetical protein